MSDTCSPARMLVVAIICLAAVLPWTGCGSKLPSTVPVTGTVLYKDQPLEGAKVMFTRGTGNLAVGELALGQTDAQGRFTLTMYASGQDQAKGATVGQYQVRISKLVPPAGMTQEKYQAMVDEAKKIGENGAAVPLDKQPPQLVEMLPAKYSLVGKSELKADVTAKGPNDFQFKLE